MTEKFYRNKSTAVVGGVCAGLGEYFGVSPVLLRLIFFLWALATPGGMAPIAYLVLWVILPEKSSLHLPAEEARRQNVVDIQSEAKQFGQEVQGIFGGTRGSSAPSQRVVWLGGLLILLGLVLLADSLHLLGWFRLRELWPLILILAGAVMLRRAVAKK